MAWFVYVIGGAILGFYLGVRSKMFVDKHTRLKKAIITCMQYARKFANWLYKKAMGAK